jgi:hypothetical protein
MYKKLIYLAILIAAISGCTDKLTFSAMEGTYSGQFHYISPLDTVKKIAPASVSFSDRTYISQRNQDRVPAGGSGSFEILRDHLLEFKDQNIWTADFDWGLILNGKFRYEVKGDSLILSRYSEPCASCSMAPSLYKYKLKRIN